MVWASIGTPVASIDAPPNKAFSTFRSSPLLSMRRSATRWLCAVTSGPMPSPARSSSVFVMFENVLSVQRMLAAALRLHGPRLRLGFVGKVARYRRLLPYGNANFIQTFQQAGLTESVILET